MRRHRLVIGLAIIIGATRFARPAFSFSTTSMSSRRLIRTGDDIRVIRGSKPLKKVSKIEKKSLPAVGLFR